jgi:LmbE family N-acetylglucosaminyl deacetylase
MSNHPTVLVLHAHPDDEAIFTGLTIRGLADAGARVVLVTATSGEEGVPRVPLRPGESMRDRRTAELEFSCGLLGVARLALLDYRDSGAHAGPYRRGTLGAASPSAVARAVAQIVDDERPDAVVHYDPRGIYGHVDHVQVHRAGAAVAAWSGATSYEATVDAEALREAGGRGGRHVLQQAAGVELDAGVPRTAISFSVHDRTGVTLDRKVAAMAAHASQIGPEYLASPDAYRHEWFVRRGGSPVIEPLLGDGVDGVWSAPGSAAMAMAVAR